MSIELPTTEALTAAEIAKACAEEEVEKVIAYLELVQEEKIHPGPEIERLLGDGTLLHYNVWEIRAVQNRFALALCLQRRMVERPIGMIVRKCAEGHSMEVLRTYNSRR